MGLKQTLKAAVQTAFKAAGNVKITIVYTSYSSTYNTATGIVTPSEADYTITNVIREDYEENEIDNVSVKSEDIKLLIPVDDLSIEPKIDDYVTLENSSKWNVINRRKDPADALWTLQIRK